MKTDEDKKLTPKNTPRRELVRLAAFKRKLVVVKKILASGSGRFIPRVERA